MGGGEGDTGGVAGKLRFADGVRTGPVEVPFGRDDDAGSRRNFSGTRHCPVRAGESLQLALIGLDKIGAARQREWHPPLRTRHAAATYRVLIAWYGVDGVKEPAFIALRRREMHGESRLGVLKTPVNVTVSEGLIPPLIDVHKRGVKQRIAAARGPGW